MAETTYYLDEKTNEVVVFSDKREVGVGVTEDPKVPYFLRFYLNPWAYTAIWNHTPLEELFPWPVLHQRLDKWSPYLIALICGEKPMQDMESWYAIVKAKLNKLNYKYGLTLSLG